MIKKTLDKILSGVQGIGESAMCLFNRHHIKAQSFEKIGNDEFETRNLYDNHPDFPTREIKHVLTKAFRKRKNVEIGKDFTLKNQRYESVWFVGTVNVSYEVKRIGKNIVELEGFVGVNKGLPIGLKYVISKSKKDLLPYRDSPFVPIYYGWKR